MTNQRVDAIRMKEFNETVKYLLRGSHLSNASMYKSYWDTNSDYSERPLEGSCCKSVRCFGSKHSTAHLQPKLNRMPIK